MAGGDGSQALVASVASRHGVPFVVVPAGTRNHFALDLGIDRDDVPGALEAFRDGVDIVVDLAEVNGRVFVNNAAMGVYAKIVQSADYRDAKVQTTAAMLPDLLGPTPRRSTCASRCPAAGAGQLLLISNNPYQLPSSAAVGAGPTGRRRARSGLGRGVHRRRRSRLAALEVAGRVSRFRVAGVDPNEIEVRSSGPVEVGVDGEALVLEPPLRFASRPGRPHRPAPRPCARRSPPGRRRPTRPLTTARGTCGVTALRPADNAVDRATAPGRADRGAARPAARERAATGTPRPDLAAQLGTSDRRLPRRGRLSTPVLDLPLRRVSDSANHSKPWFVVAGAARGLRRARTASGRPRRRRRHRRHLARGQPADEAAGAGSDPTDRARGARVPLGEDADVDVVPVRALRVGGGLRRGCRRPDAGAALAAARGRGTVAFSRVYTGVHYPGDVLVGAATGALLGRLVSRLGRRVANR